MSKPRVRFAPSPTGYLHIGGARTALFNWLWARKLGGTFILRIEDTDQARSTDESVQIILDGMRWLGLDYDEGPGVGGPHGPYYQMQRLALYREFADKLVAEGKAYRCYATKEELDRLRKEAEAKKQQFFYPHLWRDKGPADWVEGAPYVVRFKTPLSGETVFDDMVFGPIRAPHDTIQDFVLLRSDGVPLYNFGAVIDDYTMGVNLVGRGSDHIINTVPQILLYQALGAEVPRFAHLPMMLTPDGKKMSKRVADQQGIDVPVDNYRSKGWLPDAVLNYIARFGWASGDQEYFTRAELIEKFDWAHCGNKDGRYDKKKAWWVSGQHLRATADAALAAAVVPFLAARGVTVAADDARLLGAIPLVKPRAETLVDVADQTVYFFTDGVDFDEKAAAKFLVAESVGALEGLVEVLSEASDWSVEGLHHRVEAWLAASGREIKQVAQPARVALTGRAASPGLFEVMSVLGKEVSLDRLRAAARKASVTA
ncbi:MAG: glutamate--tRNA ligase [Myxococcales bacterium]|nr:glutamate--tRNA ligase [Myxococcales bacterium]